MNFAKASLLKIFSFESLYIYLNFTQFNFVFLWSFCKKIWKSSISQLVLILLSFCAFHDLLKGTNLEVSWFFVRAVFIDSLVRLRFIYNLKRTLNVTVSFDNTIFTVIPSSDIFLYFKDLFLAATMLRFIAFAFTSGTFLIAVTKIWLLVGRSEIFRRHSFLLTQSQIEEFSFAFCRFLLLFLLWNQVVCSILGLKPGIVQKLLLAERFKWKGLQLRFMRLWLDWDKLLFIVNSVAIVNFNFGDFELTNFKLFFLLISFFSFGRF